MAIPLRQLLGKLVLRLPPPLVLAVFNIVLALAATPVLMLPAAQTSPFSWGDALFTALAAVTVTGLGVISLPEHLSTFGYVVILVLIQLGGLGLMTFAVLVLSAFGLPIGLTHSAYLKEDLNQTSVRRVIALLAVILRVVIGCELAGTLLLAFVFVPAFGLGAGLWHAAFHAVSAFMNAGYSSLPGGLAPFQTRPLVTLAVPALVIIGGLGYGVLTEIVTLRSWPRLSLHAKLMLVGTVALIGLSVALFAGLEWSNPRTLGQFDGWGEKLAVAWFQGVNPRTAGFTTLDVAGLEDSTTSLFMGLMIVGAGPTSTGGGIKVTTVMVMLLATVAFFRRQTELHAFGRSIGLEEVLKVMALTAISLGVIFLTTFLLTLTHQGAFLDIAFEVASAFGTTGLSRGLTPQLDGFGRAVIMAVMFLGRVGPLTLGFFLATRVQPRVRYPAAQVFLG
ncbi:MAG: potassium transporter TrkG [Amaricoccus sp.]|uniref:TrkH family potassium uptake protein n=1 Tax=Amaricoccus sp. TaxID=1872485 RepID=UPI0039E65ECD